MTRGTCTTLDHCYPQNAPGGHTAPGTPCYCGKRSAFGAPRRKQQRAARVGDTVTVHGDGTERSVVERVRDDGEWLYRVDGAPVRGRLLFERNELEVL